METSRICVVGGTGFIGREVVRELIAARKSVGIVTRSAIAARALFPNDVDIREGDIRSGETLASALRDCDTVIHSVQFPNHPFENPRRGYTYVKIDGEGTTHVVSAARAAGARRFIYVSGAGVDGPSRETWFQAKRMAEQAVRDSGMAFTIVRPSWIYGPADRSLNKFVTFAKFLPFIPMIGPSDRQRVSPVFVGDVAKVLAGCADNPKAANQAFELGGPEILTMDEIVRRLLSVMGKRRILIRHPVAFMKAVASVLQFLPTPPLTPKGIDFVCMDGAVDLKGFRTIFPEFQLTPMDRALRTYL